MGKSKRVVIFGLLVVFITSLFSVPSITFSYLPGIGGDGDQSQEESQEQRESKQGGQESKQKSMQKERRPQHQPQADEQQKAGKKGETGKQGEAAQQPTGQQQKNAADPHVYHSSSQEDVKLNSVGGYVWELQGRLQFLGFYDAEIDGHFGWVTERAVRNFQRAFGLKEDGVAGEKTKEKLWRATRNWQGAEGSRQQGGQQQDAKKPSPAAKDQPQPQTQSKPQERGSQAPARQATEAPAPVTGNIQGFSQNDIRLMANAVYGEARGEPYVGQVAIAAVILNRVNSPLFPNTPSAVIYEPRAFTAVADGQINLSPNETAKKAVEDAINGLDPTGGAIYYFNPDTATSAWIWSRPQVKKIGKHIFGM